MNQGHRPALFALIAAAVSISWQAITVHYNYGGNWTGLYCAGALFKAPPAELASERIYRFPNSYGYDAQLYHYMAHDPFLTRGFAAAMDSPRFRYRRILVPLCAWMLAGGQDRFVDAAYLAVVLLSVFAGTWWVAKMYAGWSLAFLAVPAVLISLDRLTVDVALAALVIGVVYYARRESWSAVFVLCVLAALVRESGWLVPAGVAAWSLFERRFARALAMGASVIPAAAWYAYVHAHTSPLVADFISPVPFAGLLRRLVTPFWYPFTPLATAAAMAGDYLALAGILAAVAYCAWYARDLARRPEGFIAFAFVALVAVVSTSAIWNDIYGFTRGYSPLILLIGLDGLRIRRVAGALPLALMAPRLVLQLCPQLLHIARGLLAM
jgi:hypothetical protein